jgi:hypothetical protein
MILDGTTAVFAVTEAPLSIVLALLAAGYPE